MQGRGDQIRDGIGDAVDVGGRRPAGGASAPRIAPTGDAPPAPQRAPRIALAEREPRRIRQSQQLDPLKARRRGGVRVGQARDPDARLDTAEAVLSSVDLGESAGRDGVSAPALHLARAVEPAPEAPADHQIGRRGPRAQDALDRRGVVPDASDPAVTRCAGLAPGALDAECPAERRHHHGRPVIA